MFRRFRLAWLYRLAKNFFNQKKMNHQHCERQATMPAPARSDLDRLFDPEWYLKRYRDVADADVSPLTHYFERGAAAGYDPHPMFSSAWYLERYPDVASAGMNPLVHYVVHGGFEGRDPHPLFDTSWYLERYPDVAAAGINPFIHYIAHGVSEGRQPGPLFSGPDDWEMDRGAAAAARAKYDWARRCRKSQVPVSIAY